MWRMGACSGDHADCPWNILFAPLLAEGVTIDALNLPEARPGNRVEVVMSNAMVYKAAALTYLLPLAGLVGGAVLGFSLVEFFKLSVSQDLMGVICAGMGMAIAFLGVYRAAQHYHADYRITRILDVEEISGSEGNVCPRWEASRG